jgi:hypothetical protein
VFRFAVFLARAPEHVVLARQLGVSHVSSR